MSESVKNTEKTNENEYKLFHLLRVYVVIKVQIYKSQRINKVFNNATFAFLKSFNSFFSSQTPIFACYQMKKDIQQPEVKNIIVAIASNDGANDWSVYLINAKNEPIKDVLISSKGYGEINGEMKKTSVLRHFIEQVPAGGYAKIETIVEDVFVLNNEYWVSFYIDDIVYDKKFIFLAETIKEGFFSHIPVLDKKGVMIQ